MKLTEKYVAKLVPGKKRSQHYDSEVTGFGVRVEVNGRKTFFWYAKINGKPRFRALGQFPSTNVADARAAARKLAGDAATWKLNGYPEPDPFEKQHRIQLTGTPTFEMLVKAYIENYLRQTSLNAPRAEYNISKLIKKYLSHWLTRPIDKITLEDVLAAKLSAGEYRYMANSVVEFTRRVYSWSSAKDENGKLNFWKIENPAADVGLYETEKRTRFLQPDELFKFRAELQKKETPRDLRDFLTLSLATGARKANVYEMEWRNVSFELETWHIPMSKNGESYDVNLTPAALDVLKRRRREIADNEKFVFPARSKSGHIEDVKKNWGKFRKQCGFPDVRLHDIRRSHGSYLAIAGASMKQIADALGHKSLQSTEVYAHLTQQAVTQARHAGEKKMNELIVQASKRLKSQARASKQKLLTAGAAR